MIRALARRLNPLILRLAGTRLMPLYGVLVHRGRRSGRVYRTPVVVHPIPDGAFVVPMPWGERTDWYRNVRAAGGCTIRWRGHDYRVGQPEVVPAAAARDGFTPVLAALTARLPITHYLRLTPARVPIAA